MLGKQSALLGKVERGLPGSFIVLAYRLYKIDRQGHVDGPPQILKCEDDDRALIEARSYVDGHAIELWRDDKRVGLIPADE
jgi:hypothetical protein